MYKVYIALIENLQAKIRGTDWKRARMDVYRFLSDRERHSLRVWEADFVLARVEELKRYLSK